LKEERRRERNNKLMSLLPELGKDLENDDFTRVEIVNNNVEEGIECFSHWLSIKDGNCDEDNSKNIQLSLTTFEREKNKLLLHDNLNNLDIEVIFTDGVPFCNLCKTDDCAHTGFAICARQNLDC
jgi:hypothetical protein